MGWYISPGEPGTKYGPCVGNCSHIDCAGMRKEVATRCRICDNVIGYLTRVYYEAGNIPVHASCFEAKQDDAPPSDKTASVAQLTAKINQLSEEIDSMKAKRRN